MRDLDVKLLDVIASIIPEPESSENDTKKVKVEEPKRRKSK